MTAATVTNRASGKLAEDNVVLTWTNGETYTTKLSSIFGVQATFNEAAAGSATPICVISGRTITLTSANVTDKLVFLTVRGKK